MIFFRNLFLLLFLSLSLFSQENMITFQEIVSTDSPEELIDNEIHTYDSINTQDINNEEEIQSTIVESVDSTPREELSPIIDEKALPPITQSVEQPTPTPKKGEKSLKKTFSDAVKEAKKEHKIILLEIYGTDCHFCKKMENEVFTKESVVKEIKDNFILLKVNGDEEKIPLGITKQMTPMHVFITETEDIKYMTFGFLEEKDFLELLEKEKN